VSATQGLLQPGFLLPLNAVGRCDEHNISAVRCNRCKPGLSAAKSGAGVCSRISSALHSGLRCSPNVILVRLSPPDLNERRRQAATINKTDAAQGYAWIAYAQPNDAVTTLAGPLPRDRGRTLGPPSQQAAARARHTGTKNPEKGGGHQKRAKTGSRAHA